MKIRSQKTIFWALGFFYAACEVLATPVRGIFSALLWKPLKLEGWVKKRNCSIFYALQNCTQTFFSKVYSFQDTWKQLVFEPKTGAILDKMPEAPGIATEKFFMPVLCLLDIFPRVSGGYIQTFEN